MLIDREKVENSRRKGTIDSREHPSFDGEGERDDEDHEQTHLCHEQEENLASGGWLAIDSSTMKLFAAELSPYQAVVQSHFGGLLTTRLSGVVCVRGCGLLCL